MTLKLGIQTRNVVLCQTNWFTRTDTTSFRRDPGSLANFRDVPVGTAFFYGKHEAFYLKTGKATGLLLQGNLADHPPSKVKIKKATFVQVMNSHIVLGEVITSSDNCMTVTANEVATGMIAGQSIDPLVKQIIKVEDERISSKLTEGLKNA